MVLRRECGCVGITVPRQGISRPIPKFERVCDFKPSHVCVDHAQEPESPPWSGGLNVDAVQAFYTMDPLLDALVLEEDGL